MQTRAGNNNLLKRLWSLWPWIWPWSFRHFRFWPWLHRCLPCTSYRLPTALQGYLNNLSTLNFCTKIYFWNQCYDSWGVLKCRKPTCQQPDIRSLLLCRLIHIISLTEYQKIVISVNNCFGNSHAVQKMQNVKKVEECSPSTICVTGRNVAS